MVHKEPPTLFSRFDYHNHIIYSSFWVQESFSIFDISQTFRGLYPGAATPLSLLYIILFYLLVCYLLLLFLMHYYLVRLTLFY